MPRLIVSCYAAFSLNPWETFFEGKPRSGSGGRDRGLGEVKGLGNLRLGYVENKTKQKIK